MSDKPSLHEIAAMPYPASMMAMREHYNPHWHRPAPDEDGDLRTFRVTIDYEVRSSDRETYEVEAHSEQEAEELAEEMFDKDFTGDEEILDIRVKDLSA